MVKGPPGQSLSQVRELSNKISYIISFYQSFRKYRHMIFVLIFYTTLYHPCICMQKIEFGQISHLLCIIVHNRILSMCFSSIVASNK